MSRDTTEVGQGRTHDVDGSILEAFDEEPDGSLSAAGVAERVDADRATVRERLDVLSDRGEIRKIDLGGEYVAWQRHRETYVGRQDGDSYRIHDENTGLVTRAASRPTALRRLADRIEAYDRGDGVGAQVLGIADAAISPTYFDDVDDVLNSLVRPDDTTLYVYVEGDGVATVTSESEPRRSGPVRGFTVTAVLDRDRFDEVMLVSSAELIESTPLTTDQFPVGVFKLMAVAPDHQGRGIGTHLAAAGLAEIADAPPILALLWRRDDESNERIAEKFGFDELADFEGRSPLDGRCPQCGFSAKCSCSSTLYGWGYEDSD